MECKLNVVPCDQVGYLDKQ